MSDNEYEVEDDAIEKEEDPLDEEEEELEDEEEVEEDMSEYGDSVAEDPYVENNEQEENNIPYQVKFNSDERKKYIQDYHPEEIHKPFEEVYKLTLITRDENGTIIDDLHKTYPILSKYERSKILGLRVSQLNKGAKPYVSINNNVLDNILIAEKELKEKKIPFIIMRPLPNNQAEYWNVNDLEDL